MSEEAAQQESGNGKEKSKGEQRLPPAWWREYEGMKIAVQFKPGLEYYGWTHPCTPIIKEGMPIAVPMLSGVLKVRHDVTGVWLTLVTTDPDPNKPNVKAEITFPVDYVGFVTQLEQRLIA